MHVIVVFTKKRKSYASTYYGGSFLRIEPREYKNYNFEVSSHIFHQSHTPVVVSFLVEESILLLETVTVQISETPEVKKGLKESYYQPSITCSKLTI